MTADEGLNLMESLLDKELDEGKLYKALERRETLEGCERQPREGIESFIEMF